MAVRRPALGSPARLEQSALNLAALALAGRRSRAAPLPRFPRIGRGAAPRPRPGTATRYPPPSCILACGWTMQTDEDNGVTWAFIGMLA